MVICDKGGTLCDTGGTLCDTALLGNCLTVSTLYMISSNIVGQCYDNIRQCWDTSPMLGHVFYQCWTLCDIAGTLHENISRVGDTVQILGH